MSPYQRTAMGPMLERDGIELRMNEHARVCARIVGSIIQSRFARDSPMPSNRRSHLITQGIARSPNRAMLRAVGFGDDDFEKPIVGVANGHSTMNPCNAGIQPLVDRAMSALKDAGAMPQVFGVPTVTDGIGMGTEGMKYSLVSREVIADAIETSVNGQCMDGVLVVGGCDKNMPGGMMAIARMNVPAIYVYAGTIKPGEWKGRSSPSCRRSRRSARSPRATCRRKTTTASSATRARRSARAAACTPPTRCRRRSRRSA